MARTINVEEAASWSDEETKENLKYLELRTRFTEMARVRELRGESDSEDTALESMTAKEVAEWVGDDRERAQRALAAEQQRDEPRKGLTEHLEGMLD